MIFSCDSWPSSPPICVGFTSLFVPYAELPFTPTFGNLGFLGFVLVVLTADFAPLVFRFAGVALPVVLRNCECVTDEAGPPTSLVLVARVDRLVDMLVVDFEAMLNCVFGGADLVCWRCSSRKAMT